MKPEDYPPQEPISDFAREYSRQLLEKAAEIGGAEENYGPDPYQSVLYFPAPEPDGNVFIMIHGGGWTTGYKEWMAFMAPVFNQAGIGFVSIGYRLGPHPRLPGRGLDDCMNGLKWVYENIGKLNGDPSRLFISGHSAGGHQTSLMAVRKDWAGGTTGCPRTSCAAACLSPAYSTSVKAQACPCARASWASSGNEEAASPICNIQGAPPPFFLSWGSRDFPHLITPGAQDGTGPAGRRRRDRHPGTGRLRPPGSQPGLRRPGRPLGGQCD